VFWAGFGLVASRLYIVAANLFGDGNNCVVGFRDRENGKQTLSGTASVCRGPSGSFVCLRRRHKMHLAESERGVLSKRGPQLGRLHINICILFLISAAAAARARIKKTAANNCIGIFIYF
jgi:hypothetical protein